MNHDLIKQTFNHLTPTPEQKTRMLTQILDQVDTQAPPQVAKKPLPKHWLGLAASIAVVIGIGISLQDAPMSSAPPSTPPMSSPTTQQPILLLGTYFEELGMYESVATLKVVTPVTAEVRHMLDAAASRTLLEQLATSPSVAPDQIDFDQLQSDAFVILEITLTDGRQTQLFYTPSLGLLDLNSTYYQLSEEVQGDLAPYVD